MVIDTSAFLAILQDEPERASFTKAIEAAAVRRTSAATAEAAPELKRMAGGSAVGRKLEKPVCHYSLNWAPDETPDRREMSRAVDESLKALGLEKHQALIVAPVHFAAGARQTAAPWAGARARRRVRAMTKPYGSSLPPALWAINEEAGPSRPSSRTSSRIRRARSPENSAAGRPPRASRGATRGLGRPRSGSSPELCVKVRGSSSMLLLGCLGDLLRFEKREIQVATFAPGRSSP